MARRLFLTGVVLSLSLQFNFGLAEDIGPVIRKIVIVRENVYSDSQPEARKFPFKLANKLHLVSKEKVIRRELLFKEGERLDQKKIEETERNLRKLPFVTNVRILLEKHSDSADVYVYTQDLWTLSPSLSATGGGGRNSFSLGIDDENLLGLGHTVALYYSQDNRDFFKEEWGVLFYDPFLLPARTGVILSHNELSYGQAHYLRLNRPLYSLSTPWSFDLELLNYKDRSGFYYRGREIIRNQLTSERAKVELILAKGEYRRRELKLSYDYLYDKFRPVAYSITLDTTQFPLTKEKEKIAYLALALKLANLHFIQIRNLDRYYRDEDLELGWKGELGLGPTIDFLGSEEKSWRAEGFIRLANELFPRQYITLAVKSSMYFNSENAFRIERRLGLGLYQQGLPYQTIVLGVRGFDYTRQLKYRQFLLGGSSGLRGFEANRFSGTKAVIINLEDRFFSKLEVLSFGIGGAVFIDGGQAWSKTKEINLPGDLRWNYGIGLRLGPTKAFANRVLRFDLAKSFHSDEYFISFGLGQVFEWDSLGGD